MKPPTTPGHLAVLLLSGLSSALSLPEPNPNPLPQVVNNPNGAGGGGSGRGNAPSPVLPWVSVDPTGGATTITPSVIINTDGTRTTLSPPPSVLTSTATYTLSPGGTDRPDLASTYTGLAPVASATGTSNEAGSFLACNRGQGFDEPFCLPKRGSTLHPGYTYYVTWSPSYFAPPNISIALQARYNPSNTGFTTLYFPASVGFFAWEIPSDFLTSSSGATLSSLNVTLSLVYEDTETPDPNDIRALEGPDILIAPEPARHDDGGGDKSYAVAIAIPIIVVILLVGLAGFCVFKWKRHGRWPIIGGFVAGRRRSASGGGGGGYGERQSRSQRVGAGGVIGGGGGGGGGAGGGLPFDGSSDKQGIQLTDRDSWSPTTASAPGRNVFREEIRRQEAQR